MDDGRVTALTLLDLSAAFNTIDHTILLRRLGNWFGVSGKALDWFKSYLTGRSQRIKLGNCLSSRSDLSFGVPQRSVLCPLPFTLYTTPLSSLISGHAIPHHLYADDSQLYVSFLSGDSATALNGLQSCLTSAQSWMSTNKLKLNPNKTEFLLIGNERQRSKYLSMFPIELLGVESYPAKSARNLGVIFDKNFNFRSHISAICSSCIYHIRDLRRIRRHFDLDSAKLLANALVSSRFDYCNSLLSRMAETDLTKLQRVLNRLARVVTKSTPFTRSVPLLRSLHWLPFQDLLADLQGSTWGTACLPSLLDGHFSSITLAEIKQRNHFVGSQDQDQHWHKGLQLMCPFSLEQPSTICPFCHLGYHLQKTS